MASTVYNWMKDGFTAIPNRLLLKAHLLDLNSDELVLIIYLMVQINQGQMIDDVERLRYDLGWSSHHINETLNSLITKHCIEIELVEDGSGKKTDHFTLRPIFEQLDDSLNEDSVETSKDQDNRNILQLFEEEFGRSLSVLEMETINGWFVADGYDEAMIRLALKQAVLNQAYNLKYIDRILLNWKKRNIKTVQEAMRDINRFEQRKLDESPHLTASEESQYGHLDFPTNFWNNL